MAIALSPSVTVTEKDLTNVIPAVSTSVGATIVDAAWGPVMDVTTVDSENVFVQRFGKPNSTNATSWFTAANFLSYSNNLLVVRTDTTNQRNAVATGTAVKINNESAYTTLFSNGEGVVGEFAARFPGALGNSISVSMTDADGFSRWAYRDQFDSAPGTTSFAAGVGAVGDEMHVVVIDSNGRWTGTAGTVLETYPFVSKASDARKDNGTAAYYKTAINSTSKYIWWMDHTTLVSAESGALSFGTAAAAGTYKKILSTQTGTITATTGSDTITGVNTVFVATDVGRKLYNTAGALVGTVATFVSATSITLTANSAVAVSGAAFMAPGDVTVSLSGGVDHFTSTNGQKMLAFAMFNNDEEFDVNLIAVGKADATVANYVIQSIAEVRKDCIAFVSPEEVSTGNFLIGNTSDIAEKIIAYRALVTSSSYGVIDTGYKYQYDKYNDAYRWVPLNGDVAGLCARTDFTDDPWFSPAGFNRGQIKNVVKLAYSPKRTDRDNLYKSGVNPVVSFPGQGTVLYGDKTALTKPSAFDRINVRRLFIVLEKAIATASKYQLFEFNDGFTRAQFVGMVTPFLRDVRGRRGLTDFLVVCDETNNTGEVIDTNRFVADIYLKPARSINFIQLNFIATRTGVAFSEIAGGTSA